MRIWTESWMIISHLTICFTTAARPEWLYRRHMSLSNTHGSYTTLHTCSDTGYHLFQPEAKQSLQNSKSRWWSVLTNAKEFLRTHEDLARFLEILKLSTIFPLGFLKEFNWEPKALQKNILKQKRRQNDVLLLYWLAPHWTEMGNIRPQAVPWFCPVTELPLHLPAPREKML